MKAFQYGVYHLLVPRRSTCYGGYGPSRGYGPGGMDRGYVPGTELEWGTALPPVKRLTDTYENITCPQLLLRAVKMDAHAHS